jgi:hypothetical protein
MTNEKKKSLDKYFGSNKSCTQKTSAKAFVFSPSVYTRRLCFLNERERFAEKKSRSFSNETRQ